MFGLSLYVKGQVNAEQVVVTGRQSFADDDYVGAIQYFNLAIQSKPNQATPYLFRAIAKFNLEDFAGAEQDASHAIELNPYLHDVYEVRGAIRQKMGKYDDAIADYINALDVLPQNKYLLYNLAVLHGEVGHHKRSNEMFENLFEVYPRFDYAYRGYARMLLNEGDSLKAVTYLDKAIELNRNNHDDFMLRSHLNYFVKGDTLKAFNDIDAAIKLRPRNSSAYMMRGQMFYLSGCYNRAIENYSVAIGLDSLNVYALYNKALCYYQKGDINRAEKEMAKVVEMIEDKSINLQLPQNGQKTSLVILYPSTYLQPEYNCLDLRITEKTHSFSMRPEPLFAISYYSMKLESQFSSLYVKEIEEVNASKLLRYDLLVTSREPGENDSINIYDHLQAIDYYNYHINSPSPKPIDYFARAVENYILHNYASSIVDLDKTLEIAPDFVLGYFMRAVARAKMIKFDEIVNEEIQSEFQNELSKILCDLDYVISLRPRMAIAYYNKATVLMAQGQLDDAIVLYNKVISLEPFMGEAYYNRGYAQLKLGENSTAATDFSKAGELGVAEAYDMLRMMMQNKN